MVGSERIAVKVIKKFDTEIQKKMSQERRHDKEDIALKINENDIVWYLEKNILSPVIKNRLAHSP